MKPHLTDQDKSDCAAFFLSSGDFHGTLEMAVRLAQDPTPPGLKWDDYMRDNKFGTWEEEIKFAEDQGFVLAATETRRELWFVNTSAQTECETRVVPLRESGLYGGQNPCAYDFPVFTKTYV